MKLRNFGLALGLAGLGLVASSTPAQSLSWTLNNVTFDDGGTATGSFEYDADTNIYSSYSISVNGGNTTAFPDFTYDNSNSTSGGGAFDLGIFTPPNRVIQFTFEALTNEGGTRSFSTEFGGFELDYDTRNFRGITGGSISAPTAAVPFNFSPEQGVVLGLPLFIGLRMLKKRRALKKSTREVHEMINSR